MYVDLNTGEYTNLGTVSRRLNVSVPAHPTDAQLAVLGVAKVIPLAPPTQDVVDPGPPVKDQATGVWYQGWVSRDHTPEEKDQLLEEIRKERREAIGEARQAAFRAGMPYSVGETSFTVQTRPGDQTNLIALRIEAREVLSRYGDEPGAGDPLEFRTQENTSVYLTSQEMVDMTTAAIAHIKAIYAKSWRLKDAIDGAQDLETLKAYQWDSV